MWIVDKCATGYLHWLLLVLFFTGHVAYAQQVTVSFTQSSSDQESDGGNLPQLIVSGGTLASEATVEVNVLSGTATAGTDYSFTSPTTVTIPAKDYTTADTIPIPGLTIINDNIIERSEKNISFILQNPSSNLSPPSAGILFNYKIIDDDKLKVSFTQSSYSDQESVGGNLPELIVSGGQLESEAVVRIYLSSPQGTATVGTDYSFTNPTIVTIPAKDYTTADTIPIPGLSVADDGIAESNEDFKLYISILSGDNSADRVNLTTTRTTYTIIDDDKLEISFTQSSSSDQESVGGNLPSLRISGGSILLNVTVAVALSSSPGTATAGTDYSFTNSTIVTILAGNYTPARTIPIPGLSVTDDKNVEGDETINFVLRPPSITEGVALGSQRTMTYTITEDDRLTVSFTQSSSSDQESVGGNLPSLRVSGDNILSDVTVEVFLSGGTATAGTDYSFTSPTTVTIPAGRYSVGKNIAISGLSVTDDRLPEVDETINFVLRNPSIGGVVLGSDSTMTYTIINDDRLTVSFTQSSSSDQEPDGGNLPQLVVSGGTLALAATVEVALSSSPGTATAGTDYNPSFTSPTTVTIPAGDYTTARTIAIPGLSVTDDKLPEVDETINFVLRNPTTGVVLGSDSTTIYTIIDNDGVTVSFAKRLYSTRESVGGNFPELRVSGGDISSPVSVEVLRSGGTATAGSDYSFTSPTTVTIPAGNYTMADTIPISGLLVIDDKLPEGAEVIFFLLRRPSTGVVLGTTILTNYRIVDDDSVIVSFAESSSSGTESLNENLPSLRVSGGDISSDVTVEVALSSSPGTATAGTDYSFTSPTTVTIPAGNYLTARTIAIPGLSVTDDKNVEGDETINFLLRDPSVGAVLGSQRTTAYTITDDDGLTVSFAQASSSGKESLNENLPSLRVSGGNILSDVTVAVALSSPPGTATAGTDYSFTSPTTVTIPAGNYTPARTIAITGLSVTNDNTVEVDETINFVLRPPSTTGGVSLGSQRTTTYTITDDDGLTVTFAQASSSDQESVGGNLPSLRVSGGITSSSVSVAVALSSPPGTATAGTDYSFASPATVTIPAGDYTTPATISITGLSIINDNDAEGNETINFSLVQLSTTGGVSLGSQRTTTYTITDDDGLTVTFAQPSSSDQESVGGNLPSLRVSGGITSSSVSIDVALSSPPGTATAGTDYSFTSPATVTIPAGDYTTPATISITGLSIINDNDAEGNETINFVLRPPSTTGGVSLGSQRTTTYTITDDDGLTVTFAQPSSSDQESVGGNLPSLRVSGGNILSDVTVAVALSSPPGTATAGTDYSFTNPATVTIPAGDYTTARTIAIPGLSIINDNDAEGDETINFSLVQPSTTGGFSLGSQRTTTYTITDDDGLTVSFAQASSSGKESLNENLPSLRVSGGNISSPVSVAVALSSPSGTATAGSDYSFTSPATVTIPAGNYTPARTIALPGLSVTNDNTVEVDETINFVLRPPSTTGGFSLGSQRTTTYTITDDDGLTVSFAQPSSSDQESVGGNLPSLRVSGGITSSSVSVAVALSSPPGTATAGTDYSFTSPATVTIPAGDYTTARTIAITGLAITDDNTVEGDETIIFTLVQPSTTGGFSLGSQRTTTYTITDDDGLTVSFAESSSSDQESVGGNLPSLRVSGGNISSDVTVAVALSSPPGTATAGTDYSFTSPTTVTIPAGDYTTARTIALPGLSVTDDNTVEGDETINFVLRPPSTTGGVSLGSQRTTTYTITDDDGLTASFAQASSSGNESLNENLPSLRVSGGDISSDVTVAVALSSPSGTATAGTDYSFTSPATVTIPAGDYTTPATISITGLSITDDKNVEGDETIIFTLVQPSTTGGVLLGSQRTTTYTITDDDGLTVSFAQASSSDQESVGGNLSSLRVSGGNILSDVTVAVDLSSSPGTATAGTDYSFTSPTTVTIPAGNYTPARTIALPGLSVTDDNTVEGNEMINFVLRPPSTTGGIVLGSQRTTTYTIIDEDKVTVSFAQASSSDSEGLGGRLPTLTVSGGKVSTLVTVEVSLSSPPGTATAGTDYSFTNPTVVTIPVGDYTTAKSIALPGLSIVNDQLLEPDETFTLTLGSASLGITLGTNSTTTYTIIDDDKVTVSFTKASSSDQESVGGNLPELIVSGGISSSSVSVEVSLLSSSTATAGTDYSFTNPTVVTIPAGDYTTARTIAIPGLSITDDNTVEGDETIGFQLRSSSPQIKLGTQQTTVYTIKEDDTLILVSLATDKASIVEAGGKAILTASLTIASATDIVVGLSFSGGASTADYVVSAQQITIVAGSLSGSITVTGLVDDLYEGDEKIVVDIETVSGGKASENGNQQQVVTIQDKQATEDKDGDGIPNNVECPIAGSCPDTDGDGKPNYEDTDSDNDGRLDKEEGTDDCDNNGTPNYIDAGDDLCFMRIIFDTGFSPNGDGINDYWFIKGIDKFPGNVVTVYNRWGNVVYTAQDYDNRDKRFSGLSSGANWVIGEGGLPSGTYYYVIDLKDGKKVISGYIAIHR